MNTTLPVMREPRSPKKNLRDHILLASWITVYSMLLLGFGILKEFERSRNQGGRATAPIAKAPEG